MKTKDSLKTTLKKKVPQMYAWGSLIKRKVCRIIYKLLFAERHYDTFLHISDIFYTTYAGKRIIPYSLIGKILDTEAFYQGDDSFKWQMIVDNISPEKIGVIKNRARDLINSLDEFGLNPMISRARIRGTLNSFAIDDGQHRVAWQYINEQLYVPVRIFYSIKWDRNEKYYEKYEDRLNKDTDMFRNYYDSCVDSLSPLVFSVIDVEYASDPYFLDLMERGGVSIKGSNSGVIMNRGSTLDGNVDISKSVRRTVKMVKRGQKNGHVYSIYEVSIANQRLYVKGKRVRSFPVLDLSKMLSDYTKKKFWGYIPSTVTEGLELKSLFERIQA